MEQEQNNMEVNTNKTVNESQYLQPSYFDSPEYALKKEAEMRIFEYEKQRNEYKSIQRYLRMPLIFSLLGLILGLFYGLGLGLSIAGFVLGILRHRVIKNDWFKWAIAVGLIGMALSLAFIVSLICVNFII